MSSEQAMEEEIQSRIITIGRSQYQCAECGQLSSQKANMWKHIESKHTSPRPVNCLYCEKVCLSKNALATHMSRYHRNVRK